MNPHQRCLQAKVKYRNEPKQVMPKSEDLSRSLEINAIWTFDTEFPTIFNKSCTYITFKSAVIYVMLCISPNVEHRIYLTSKHRLLYVMYVLAPTWHLTIGGLQTTDFSM